MCPPSSAPASLLSFTLSYAALIATNPPVARRLVALLRDAVSPHGLGAGLHFSTRCNATCSVQAERDSDGGLPLWQRSSDEFWWNAPLSEPLCRAPLPLHSWMLFERGR